MKKKLRIIAVICWGVILICGLAACVNDVDLTINFIVDEEVYASVSTSRAAAIKMPPNPTKYGYTFDGWYWDNGTWQNPFTVNSLLDAPLSNDMSVYAKFISNHNHEYTETITKKPTCTESGFKTLVCSCGESYTENLSALGHNYDNWINIIEATCTTDGLKKRICHICKHEEAENISAVGHKYDDWQTITEATCITNGLQKRICSVCGESEETKTIPALGHDYNEKRECVVCGEKYWLMPKDIQIKTDLTNYGNQSAYYEKEATSFVADTKMYAGISCIEQITKLQTCIARKEADVLNGDSTSSIVKIFAMSKPEGILGKMAKAALSYDEMNKVVDILCGDGDACDINAYAEMLCGDDTRWCDLQRDDSRFNASWSVIDDIELYCILKRELKFTDEISEILEFKNAMLFKNEIFYEKMLQFFLHEDMTGFEWDVVHENIEWQFRSILEKIYNGMGLSGDGMARLITYLLEYAVELVETKAGGSAEDAIVVSGGSTNFNEFADYCKNAPSPSDPFSGLQDYKTLSFLLAFNEYYKKTEGLKNCVTLFGYYYDFIKDYFNVVMKDEDLFARQLRYKSLAVFTDAEWLDYVAFQRDKYERVYRYSENCYASFFEYHFGFQSVIEDCGARVYEISRITREIGSTALGTTYTSEMKSAIAKTGSINGLAGQLALSDWMWCYSASETRMKDYNAANTQYENGMASGNCEQKYEGKFNFEMQQLYIVRYLLTNMTVGELSSVLHYNVYVYSASMVNSMIEDIKKIVYIKDDVEDGSYYTNISADVSKGSEDVYAQGKIKVIYDQTYDFWKIERVSVLATNASSQNWSKMKSEIQAAIDYDYENMSVKSKNTQWLERTERLEDLVIARVWSCCGQKVSEADDTKCPTGHAENPDGTVATKEYATDHTISQFVSNYEFVLMHIGGQAKVSFRVASKGYKTQEASALKGSKTWEAGYNGTIAALRADKTATTQLMTWGENKAITVSSGGATFIEEMESNDDSDWWTFSKENSEDAKFDAEESVETYGGTNISYTYSYVFKGWYLDKDCKYEFDENDVIDVNLRVYAGYTVTKTRK